MSQHILTISVSNKRRRDGEGDSVDVNAKRPPAKRFPAERRSPAGSGDSVRHS